MLPEGAQIVENERSVIPMTMVGHVTSSYFSPSLNRSIALAVVKGGQARMGQRIWVPLDGGRMAGATIASPVFFDAEGSSSACLKRSVGSHL